MRSVFSRTALTTATLATVFIGAGRASAANGEPCAALTDEDSAVPTLTIENYDSQ